MFYAIMILLLFSAILLIVDHKSRYTYISVLMAVGITIVCFSLVLHINMFGNYYFYSSSLWFSLDYKIYSYIINNIRIPLSTAIRIMNAGHFLYLTAGALMCNEILKILKNYEMHHFRLLRLIELVCFLIPLFQVIYCDPCVSTAFYMLCHRSALFYPFLMCLTGIYKALVISAVFYSVFLLYKYSACMRTGYLKYRILLLADCLFFLHSAFISFFYLGSFSISPQKVRRSGFWIFENTQFDSQKFFFYLPIVILILLGLYMAVLLSFRLDSSTTPFFEKKLQQSLSTLSDALSDSLHSQKNLLFTLQILLDKTEKKLAGTVPEEIRKIQEIVAESLESTTRILDNLRAIKYKFHKNNLVDIVEKACRSICYPDQITLELVSNFKNYPYGTYDKYHLEKALTNILSNSVEAITASHKENGYITVNIEIFFQWAIIVITDNGTGISKREKRKLFLPHYSNKSGTLNWGLGLSYVYKVIKAHYGQIKIVSKKGKYTSFFIMLPLK